MTDQKYCTECGLVHYGNHDNCSLCRQKNWQDRRYEKRVDAGLCGGCGGKPARGKVCCQACIDRANRNGKARRAKAVTT